MSRTAADVSRLNMDADGIVVYLFQHSLPRGALQVHSMVPRAGKDRLQVNCTKNENRTPFQSTSPGDRVASKEIHFALEIPAILVDSTSIDPRLMFLQAENIQK